jgi:serine/threonine protein phosphatase PrpC
MSQDIPEHTQIQFELGMLTAIGGRAKNEDACAHWSDSSSLCCVVADGAGGHGGGDKAARLAVEHLIVEFAQNGEIRADWVRDALKSANAQVRSERAAGSEWADMYSTVVGLFIDQHKQIAHWGHVGDARIYVFRNGELAQRSKDHSLMQTWIDEGLMTEEQAQHHAKRSELLCALGSAPEDLLIGVSDKPWRILEGDTFLLCSDGLWEYFTPQQLATTLKDADDPQDWLLRLESIVKRNSLNKAVQDNYSAISVWVKAA